MNEDDVIYAVLLFISLPIGVVIRSAGDPKSRQILSTCVGLLMITVVCRLDALHSLFSATVNTAIISLVSPKICHKLCFVWSFGYIAFFRTTHYFGLPQVSPHSNAVQLLLTLKMVGVAFEIHDSWVVKQEENKNSETLSDEQRLINKYIQIRPTFFDIICYDFCYIGLLTGPYYKFRTYYDMLHDIQSKRINTLYHVLNRLKYIVPAISVYLLVSSVYTIEYCRQDEFYTDRPLWYRVAYMVPMFIVFRTRLYIAWIAAECMCITATLGAYPTISKPRCGSGPSDFVALNNWNCQYDTQYKDDSGDARLHEKYSYETIGNIDIYGCELAPTVRQGMRSWNQTVQYWLASCVYRRLPFKAGVLRVAVTMMVSAFWHGVHAGYYLSFITIPINLVAEDLMIDLYRHRLGEKVFDWLCWFCKMRSFDYMCMAFILLRFDYTIRYWSSTYFIGHVFMFGFIIVGSVQSMLYKRSGARTKMHDK